MLFRSETAEPLPENHFPTSPANLSQFQPPLFLKILLLFQEIRTEGLSGMMKALLIAMGVMAVILIALLIALHIKNG